MELHGDVAARRRGAEGDALVAAHESQGTEQRRLPRVAAAPVALEEAEQKAAPALLVPEPPPPLHSLLVDGVGQQEAPVQPFGRQHQPVEAPQRRREAPAAHQFGRTREPESAGFRRRDPTRRGDRNRWRVHRFEFFGTEIGECACGGLHPHNRTCAGRQHRACRDLQGVPRLRRHQHCRARAGFDGLRDGFGDLRDPQVRLPRKPVGRRRRQCLHSDPAQLRAGQASRHQRRLRIVHPEQQPAGHGAQHVPSDCGAHRSLVEENVHGALGHEPTDAGSLEQDRAVAAGLDEDAGRHLGRLGQPAAP